MSLFLPAGTYTILLTDADYIPVAVDETDGTLGDGFFDLTGGVFQTCNGLDCVTDSDAWALDITTPGSVSTVPEPGPLPVLGVALFTLVGEYRRRRRISISEGEQK